MVTRSTLEQLHQRREALPCLWARVGVEVHMRVFSIVEVNSKQARAHAHALRAGMSHI